MSRRKTQNRRSNQIEKSSLPLCFGASLFNPPGIELRIDFCDTFIPDPISYRRPAQAEKLRQK
jgi:hypothetical protein